MTQPTLSASRLTPHQLTRITSGMKPREKASFLRYQTDLAPSRFEAIGTQFSRLVPSFSRPGKFHRVWMDYDRETQTYVGRCSVTSDTDPAVIPCEAALHGHSCWHPPYAEMDQVIPRFLADPDPVTAYVDRTGGRWEDLAPVPALFEDWMADRPVAR